MPAEEYKALVRRFVDEVQTRGNLAAIDELAAPTFVNHTAPPGVPPTRDGLTQLTALFRTAFPDGQMTIEDLIADGETVVTRKTFRGTHRGELMGIPPTGREVAMGLIDIVRLADGKVVEHWNQADTLGLQQLLGVLPVPGQSDR